MVPTIADRSPMRLRAKLALSCAMIGVIAVRPAAAQTVAEDGANTAVIEEIIVTAQKRSENIQDVPIAIAAFSADMLDAANVRGIADLVSLTPSLRFQYGGPGGTVFLRGVGNSQQFAGAESEVQTYVDGLYYGSAGAAYLRFNNIERVEVDKGPQGTLFGRNATGGVIQIITRDPSQESRFDASLGYGNYNAMEGDLYVGGRIADGVAADFSVHFEDREGWGRNTVTNRDVFTAESLGLRSKWVIDPVEQVRATIIVDYGRDVSDLGVSYVLQDGPWRPSAFAPAPAIPPAFTLTEESPSRAIIERYGASLKLEADIGDLTAVSITGYRKTDSRGFLDADGTPFPVIIGNDFRTEEQASQEFQLLSGKGGPFQWIVGAYLYYNKGDADPARLMGGPPSRFGATAIETYTSLRTHSIAGFGQATYDITDSTHITAGLRYTSDRREIDVRTVFVYPTGPGAPPPFLGLNQTPFPTKATFNALTGKILVAQDLSEDVMIYGGYSRGFKSGTFNNAILLGNPQPALDPEYIDAFEGGLKSDLFDGRVRLNLAAFHYKYTNLQVNKFEPLAIALRNAASARIKGLEADVQVAVTPSTKLTGGFGLLDAEYTDFLAAPFYAVNPISLPNPPAPVGVGGFGGVIITERDATGNRLPQAPKFSGYLGLTQTIELGGGKIDLNANLSYQSRIEFTPDNQFGQEGYANLSASAKWMSSDGRWDLTLWGRNLTDKNSISNVAISGFRVGGIPNEPLSYGARVGFHF